MVILSNLKKEDFDEILAQYTLGKYKSHKHIDYALANTVYVLRTTRKKYLLKVFERSGLDFIDFQIKVMDILASQGIPLPAIIHTTDQNYLLNYGKHKIVVFEFISGHEPTQFTNSLIKDIARQQAHMIKILHGISLNGKDTWKRNSQFKLPPSLSYNNFDLREQTKSLLRKTKINKKKLRRSIIHGDFHGSNLLVHNNALKAVIDWDDIHEDFLVQDCAVFIAHTFITNQRIKKRQLQIYVREFNKYFRLNSEEKKALYLFTMIRLIGALSYLLVQRKIHKDQEFEKNIIKFITRYKLLDKFGYQSFRNLVR